MLEDNRGSLADLNIAIKINSTSKTYYLNRGKVKYKLSDLNGACLDWSKAGELGETDAYDSIKKHCK